MTQLTPLSLALPPLRRATPADAAAIARVHVTAWRETYAGILPDHRVQRASEADRTLQWQGALAMPGPDGLAVFLAQPGGTVAGFLCMGRQRSPALAGMGFDGEVSALYLVAAAQGRGLGRALMSVAAHHLLDTRGRGLALWSLAANRRACGFYAALGGRVVAERTDGDGPQRAYGWDDPGLLL